MARIKYKARRQPDSERQAATPDARYTVLSLRVNSEESTLIRGAVPKGMSMNQWLRELALNAIGR